MTKSEKPIGFNGVNLTGEDAIAFLAEVETNPKTACPICSHHEWGLNFSPGEGQYAAIPTRATNGEITNEFFLGVYTVQCLKCGYLRLHSLVPLARWKKSKDELAGEGEPK